MHDTEHPQLEIVRRPPSVLVPCRFTPDEQNELKAFAEKHGATVSDVVRSSLIQCGVITVRAAE